jgi:superfamily II DNA or RNA helicase
MVKLIIEDRRCRLSDVNDEDRGLLWSLDKELSYMVQGAQFSRAYKHGYMNQFTGQYVNWDGKNNLFDESNLSFPIGLKQRVIDFCDKFDTTLDLDDRRSIKSVGRAIDILPILKSINKIPRLYQIDAMKATRDSDCGIIRAPTGAGKTLIATLITADIGKKTVIYVIGKDLLHQLYGFFKKVFPDVDIGIIGDGICQIGDINVASVWTVGQAIGMDSNKILIDTDNDEKNIEPEKYAQIRELIKSAKTAIIDECHVSACDTIQELSKHINPEHIYGMSASPWRDDNADLLIEAVLGPKIVDISATKLINEGYLVKPIIKFVRIPKYHKKLKKNYKSIYKTYICENKIRNQYVVDYTKKLVGLGYKPLVLYNSVNHGKILHKLISEEISCTLLSGKDKMETREGAKLDIENGNIQAIIASKIFDIGVDIPALSGLIVAGSGKSSVRALQRIGRVIRPYEGKKQAAVVDFIDNAHYVKKHSQARKEIYSLEEGFEVKWPKN